MLRCSSQPQYISLPITFVSIVIVMFVLPFKPVKGSWRTKLKQLDYAGSALTLVWAILILLGLSWGGKTFPWDSAAVLSCLILGIVLLAFFVYVEAKWVKLPIIPSALRLGGGLTLALIESAHLPQRHGLRCHAHHPLLRHGIL